MRKDLLAGSDDLTETRAVGSQIVVGKNGALFSANADGVPVGLFVRNSEGGVALTTGDDIMEEARLFLADEAEPVLMPGEKASSQQFDNFGDQAGEFGRVELSKTGFDKPIFPRENTLPTFAPSANNPFPSSTSRAFDGVPRVGGRPQPEFGDSTLGKSDFTRPAMGQNTFSLPRTTGTLPLNQGGASGEIIPRGVSSFPASLKPSTVGEEGYEAWANAHLKKIGEITPDEARAVQLYAGDGNFGQINRFLRGGADETLDDGSSPQAVIDQIDSLMNKGALKQSLTVYRGIPMGRTSINLRVAFQKGELKPGTVFPQEAYSSATVSQKIAERQFAGGGTVFEIQLPAGAKALPLGKLGIPDEAEVLIGRG